MLSTDVDFLTLRQAARSFWHRQQRSIENARAAIVRLRRNGWLAMRSVFARPIHPLLRPLATWQPHTEPPDFYKLARRLHTRARASAEVTIVISATQKSRDRFGDGSRRPAAKLAQMTHELHVAEILFAYHRRGLENYCWLNERSFAPYWSLPQLPDALLVDPQGRPARAIEYGGDYSPQRLQQLHETLAAIPLSYECW